MIIIIALAAAAIVAFLLSHKKKPSIAAIPLPETFEQMLLRTEGVTVSDISGDASENANQTPVNPKLVHAAFVRGRNRVIKVYPAAADVKMSQIIFYRPKIYFNIDPTKPYPLINEAPEGLPPVWIRGVTSPAGPVFVQYAYEQCIEHETTHAIVRILDPSRLRTPEAINNPADTDQKDSQYFFQITCHDTSDDLMGDGPPGNRTSCALPYGAGI